MTKYEIHYSGPFLLAALAVSCFFLNLIYYSNIPVIYKGITDEKIVALTFDDGPDPTFSPEIVRILNDYQIKATFFVVGEQVEKYPEILKMEYDAGHEIANHSYTHRNMDSLDSDAVIEEITRTNGIIHKYTGQHVNWFRPPRCKYDMKVKKEVKCQGMDTVLWTSVIETKMTKDPEQMALRVAEQIRPGGIILLHDSRLDRTLTVKALPILIENLQMQGYRFVTISELLNKDSKSVVH
ncbi:polysaccharide deacetylase family protein [Phosphitispora sp. TUW77]|uniref:polysaccharide deacetylase family protein n=1 Tax=Phosphitispora sp. TUW77 TaxID=3152361 RepID=UPI003AB7A1DC